MGISTSRPIIRGLTPSSLSLPKSPFLKAPLFYLAQNQVDKHLPLEYTSALRDISAQLPLEYHLWGLSHLRRYLRNGFEYV